LLCIEPSPATVAGKVEEVVDSDVESGTGVDSDAEDAAAGTLCPPLCQLTLFDLFEPGE
jgi:hypothetical protein